jgi:hypothetical protein
LDQEELEVALEMRDSPEAKDAITLSVGATDGAKERREARAIESKPAPTKKPVAAIQYDEDEEEEAPAPKRKKPAPVIEAEVEEEEDDTPAPVVRNAKKAVVKEEEATDLDDLLGEWDD